MTTTPLITVIAMEMRMMRVTGLMIMVLCWLSEQCPCFHLGSDGERQTEGTDASRKRDTRSSAGHHKSEDTSDSREEDGAVSLFFLILYSYLFVLLHFRLTTLDRVLMG